MPGNWPDALYKESHLITAVALGGRWHPHLTHRQTTAQRTYAPCAKSQDLAKGPALQNTRLPMKDAQSLKEKNVYLCKVGNFTAERSHHREKRQPSWVTLKRMRKIPLLRFYQPK